MVKEKYKNITNFNDNILSIWIKLHKNIYIYLYIVCLETSIQLGLMLGGNQSIELVKWIVHGACFC